MAVRIKRYENRKLYDEGSSSYISVLELSDLAAKEAAGNCDVKVICDRTGEDVAVKILSRALYERLKSYLAEGNNTEPPFPASVLVRLIAKVPATPRRTAKS